MRKMVLAAAITALPFLVNAAEDEFYGTYTLISTSRTRLDTGQVETFARERGFITYGKDGRMMVIIVRGDRPKAESIEKMTDQQRAELHRLMTAYGGTYKFDGKTMEHHIDISWNELWTGTTQFRDVKKDGNRLIYTTHPAPNARDGKMSITTLVWEKVKQEIVRPFQWLTERLRDSPEGVQLRQYFLNGMRELGYVEGRDFDIIGRLAESTSDLPRAAKDLVQLNPDVIVATASANALAAKMATSTIPIVVPAFGNPVALGLIESYSHPGGNLTGIMPYVSGLPSKQLELAREIVPGALKIGIVNDPIDAKATAQWDEMNATAAKLEIKIVRADVQKPEDIDQAFKKFEAEHAEVAIVLQSNLLFLEQARMVASAAATRLPTVYGYRVFVEAGGLISYGVDLNACLHRAATYVYKILNGARAADLPVELPTKLELAINMKAAKELGIAFPTAILVRADHVIEQKIPTAHIIAAVHESPEGLL